jgi:Holliday junction resolvase
MSGARHRRKGSRVEREIVQAHRDIGIDAERVPLSGAARGSFSGDVVIKLNPELRGEVKARAGGAGFVTLERWLGTHDVLFLRRDRAEPIVVLPWSTYARLAGGAK